MTTSAGLTAALADFVVGMAEHPVPDAAAAVVLSRAIPRRPT